MIPVHVNFDDAWDVGRVGMRTIDALPLGPHLRYTAPAVRIQRAMEVLGEGLAAEDFILYGSGDFHYLAAWWLKRMLGRVESASLKDVTVVSFDNHPDWDVRPPRWACGGWVNRALELPGVGRVSVWGCGNFELGFPARIFRNKKALAAGRLEVHAWAERQSAAVARKFDCMTRGDWRERFSDFVKGLGGGGVYVTVDLDALAAEHAVTNWENGLFTPEDIVWALGELRGKARVFGGDCCGAFSVPAYARAGQRFVGNFDHPKVGERAVGEAREVNHRTLGAMLPALIG